MLPVDLMVEILMGFADVDINDDSDCPGEYIIIQNEELKAASTDELREKIRTYLQSLVPPPKLLSECEEHVGVPVNDAIMIYRVGKHAYRSEDDRWYGYADMCQVIQPVEVNREDVSEAS